MYCCSYLPYGQQLFTAHRNFEHRTTADAETGRLLMQRAQEIDPAPYLARLRQAQNTIQSLANNPRRPEAQSPRQSGLCIPPGRS